MNRDLKKALFDGYIESDGCISNEKLSSTSINKGLCLGMKAIAGSLGYASCLVRNDPKREAIIDGRHVNEHPWYRQQYEGSPRSSFFFNYGWFGLVRKVLPGRSRVTVYNIEVEDDNSYLADGIAVHNCQSFSVAGKREGLSGESGLMFEFIRCVREVRPRWFLWENVPGALSVERGKAFGQLLSEMADGGGYGCAWRVLDAQFFGVAQRRRRLFLVGRAGNGFREACQVLFESPCVPGSASESKGKREELAARAGRYFNPTSAVGINSEQPFSCNEDDSKTTVLQPDGTSSNGSQNGSGVSTNNVVYTLNTRDKQSVLCRASTQANAEQYEDMCPAQSARQYKDPPIVIYRAAYNQGIHAKYPPHIEQTELMDALVARGPHAVMSECDSVTNTRNVVRRLTPTECERLQGFKDEWTKVPYKGRPAEECPDTPRYKAIGNSMAVPVMRWIGRRIQMVDEG
jgi:DNA (cytosine-5)-methyltransferase 1